MSTPSTRKTKRLRDQDPFLERERSQYTDPLPSREFILQVLQEKGIPVVPEALAQWLSIRPEEDEVFFRRLKAMMRDGQLALNRKGALCVPDKIHLVAARVHGHPDGYGFAIPDDGSPDFVLDARQMRQVMHGDRVMVQECGVDRRGRREGRVMEVLTRAVSQLVGRYREERGIGMVVPENRRISQEVMIPVGEKMAAQPGQVVMVEITAQPSLHQPPIGRVTEVLGHYLDPGMEIEIALRKHDLPHVWPEAVETLAKKTPKSVRKQDWQDADLVREDIRHLPLVTIDGETARDFDDAVYCERQGKGFRLLVAIADVSHYVKPGSALDAEAYARGTSVYFPRRVIPMLPEQLSNGMCSLNPKVERLCMVCDMVVTPTGDVKRYRFYPAVMYSHARLTYNQVQALLDDAEAAAQSPWAERLPDLQNLHAVFQVLLKAREKRGAIDFDTTETQILFDEQGRISAIVPVVRVAAHKLIEECMLAANVCAASFLAEQGHALLYRVHQGPTAIKLEALRGFLGPLGFDLSGGDEPKAKDYARLLSKIRPRPDAELLQTVLLRSMQQAVYSPDNEGHFGLGYEAYAHFTSPIRRYPDLLVHRAIKAVLAKKPMKGMDWTALGQHCSMTERRADEASRDVLNWLKCMYMQDRVGECFSGRISSVTSFGAFVMLDHVFVEGLVHITELGSDYFVHEPAQHELRGERTGLVYRLGDPIAVKLARVDMDNNRIELTLAAPSVLSDTPLGGLARAVQSESVRNTPKKEKRRRKTRT